MKLTPQSVEHLNRLLPLELTTRELYRLQSRMFDNWGLDKLAKRFLDDSGDGHDERLMERILFLEGVPNMTHIPLEDGAPDVQGIFSVVLALETRAAVGYRAGIVGCLRLQDDGTRALLERILISTEEHINWVESQFKLIELMGLQAYLVVYG
jgi:bacterioferritin